nr:hypothetical protein [Tanacetum cinerariifolium]
VKSTTRTKRPLPRNDPKNDKAPSNSKSSRLSNNLEKIEENHRNLQSSSNKKHMSSECNNIKIAIRNAKSEVVSAMYKVVNLLEKEKVNFKTIESLKSKGFESSENVSSELENQTKNDCLVVEKEYDKEKNPKVIAPGMFKMNDLLDDNNFFISDDVNVRSSPVSKMPFRKKPHVKSTTRTKRPLPRNDPKNDKAPSNSKSSRLSNNLEKIEENHRNLQSSSNKKHMSSECNNIKIAIRNAKSEVVSAMCKQCLITVNHNVCVLIYVNGMNSRGKKQKAQKAYISKRVESPIVDAVHDESENESSSDSEGLNYGGETTDNLKDIIRIELEELKKGGMNDSRNEMETYYDFMACDVPKFDGTLDPIACTKWLSAVKGAFHTSCCKEKNKVNFTLNFLRDSAKIWWEGKIYEKEVDKNKEEFQTLTQTNKMVNEMWKKFNDLICYCPEYHENEKLKVEKFQRMLRDDIREFNDLICYCPEYHENEKLKVEKFQRMLRDDIREVISPFKCTTLEDLLSRARLREAGLLRKKNKETKRKLIFVDRDAKKPKKDQGQRSGGTQIKTPCKKCHKTYLGLCRANLPGCYKCGALNHMSKDCKKPMILCYNCNHLGHKSNECPNPKAVEAKPLKLIKEEKVKKTGDSYSNGSSLHDGYRRRQSSV